jgi:hypothetical protein
VIIGKMIGIFRMIVARESMRQPSTMYIGFFSFKNLARPRRGWFALFDDLKLRYIMPLVRLQFLRAQCGNTRELFGRCGHPQNRRDQKLRAVSGPT